MEKINLDQPILDIKGEEIIDEQKDDKGKVKKVKRTLRENLLKALGVQYDATVLTEPKQYTWIYNLSNLFNGKEKIVEVSDDKLEFLRKLIKTNKAILYRQTPVSGVQKVEIELFFPYEVGEMLVMLGEKEE